MQMTSSMDNVEVTQEDFRAVAMSIAPSSQSKPQRNLTSRLNNLFHKNRSSRDASVSSDRATADSGSLAETTVAGNITLSSLDTIKVSNRTAVTSKDSQESKGRATEAKKNPWRKLKKMMGKNGEQSNVSSSSSVPPFLPGRSRSLSHPSIRASDVDDAYPMRKRVESENNRSQKKTHNKHASTNGQELLDEAIRGRFDGHDVLSLGSARLASVPRSIDPLTRHAPMLLAQDMVADMLRTSAGRQPPELILEGFIANDRWLVGIDATMVTHDNSNTSAHVPQLQSTDDESSMDGSPTLSTPKLLASIWGRDRTPPPSHAQPEEADNDDIFQLAARCAVPIDIDEETFIIENPTHLQAVHDIASIPLKAGRFDDAIDIFLKILKGLEMRHGDEPHHLIGTTLHNIGVLQLWQRRYKEAWENFNQAVSVRKESLSHNHPDIAVSLAREGTALFALEKWNDALHALEKALAISTSENATRAKILNNIGVVHYQRKDNVQAMQSFAEALEIQRLWLDSRVRRNSIIYDASVTMGNMGKIHLEQENYHLCFFVHEEALLLQTTAFPKDHDIVLQSLDSIAYARAREGDYQKAIHLYRGILRSQDARFGPNSKESMETTKLLGILFIKDAHYEEALRCFTTLFKWQKARLATSDPELQRTKECIKRIESDMDGEVSVWV